MFSKQSVQAQRGTVGSSSQRASWNDLQKENLLQQLHNFPRERRGGWSKDTWVKITEVMKGMFPSSNFTTQQLKQQEQDLRKLYNKVGDILVQPGFTWDDKNCMLQASNDSWQLLSETNGRLSWSRRIIPYYAALDALYKDRDVDAQEDAGDIASRKANEQAAPSHDHAFDIASSPSFTMSSLLITLDDNPQAAEFSESLAPPILSSMTSQSNPMPLNIPAQHSNFQPFSHFASIEPSFGLGSSLSHFHGNIPAIDDNETGNNDTGMGHDPSLSAPLNPDHASTSQQPGKQNSFSNHPQENPLRKVREKKEQKKKNWAKSNFSMMRCISMLNELQEFENDDIECAVEIFKDKLYRQAFVSMKRSHKVSWLQKKIGKGK